MFLIDDGTPDLFKSPGLIRHHLFICITTHVYTSFLLFFLSTYLLNCDGQLLFQILTSKLLLVYLFIS